LYKGIQKVHSGKNCRYHAMTEKGRSSPGPPSTAGTFNEKKRGESVLILPVTLTPAKK
jgi:hypothetical protein